MPLAPINFFKTKKKQQFLICERISSFDALERCLVFAIKKLFSGGLVDFLEDGSPLFTFGVSSLQMPNKRPNILAKVRSVSGNQQDKI